MGNNNGMVRTLELGKVEDSIVQPHFTEVEKGDPTCLRSSSESVVLFLVPLKRSVRLLRLLRQRNQHLLSLTYVLVFP